MSVALLVQRLKCLLTIASLRTLADKEHATYCKQILTSCFYVCNGVITVMPRAVGTCRILDKKFPFGRKEDDI
jgi:hypothetical protein